MLSMDGSSSAGPPNPLLLPAFEKPGVLGVVMVEVSSSCFITSTIQLKRSFIMPVNISGDVEMYLLTFMMSSCIRTARYMSCGKIFSYRISLIFSGVSGFEISTSLFCRPSVRILPLNGFKQRDKICVIKFLNSFMSSFFHFFKSIKCKKKLKTL